MASVSESTKLDGYSNSDVESILEDHENIRILDGLQRTHSIIEVFDEDPEFFEQSEEEFNVRVELYLAIKDSGILYRMLTLNTGQTPMSLRHQLEILYSKYLNSPIDGLNIIKEIDDSSIRSILDYKFSDLIEGYEAFLEGNEMPIDRYDIIQNVRTIENISRSPNSFLSFVDFVKAYSSLSAHFDSLLPGWEYPDDESVPEEYYINANPYGRSIYRFLNRSQTLTGYGAAISKLVDLNIISGVDQLIDCSGRITPSSDDLLYLAKCLDDIRERSKKIGNGQRIFFKFLFRNLFDREGEAFLDFRESIRRSHQRALSEV